MARFTGKNGKLLGVSTRTTVSSPETLTDVGAHTVFTFAHRYMDSSIPPTILVNGGAALSSYVIDYILGTITFSVAVLTPYTVTANAFVYNTLAEVGDLYNWTLDTKADDVDVTGFQDVWHQKLITHLGWDATAEGYKTSGYWFTAFTNGLNFYIAFYPDKNVTTEFFVGNGWIDWNTKVAHNAAVTETIKIKGTEAIARLTS
jgi:hypothetical protein